jgi:hypothetical protein
MEAKGWKGPVYGIRVGKRNRAAYFDPAWPTIGVEIEGTLHECNLPPSFWRNCPEFRSAEIHRWLHAHGLAPWPNRQPPALELTPLGGNRFRLSAP